MQASAAAVPGLWSTNSGVVVRSLVAARHAGSSQARDRLAGRFLITEPPGKPPVFFFF